MELSTTEDKLVFVWKSGVSDTTEARIQPLIQKLAATTVSPNARWSFQSDIAEQLSDGGTLPVLFEASDQPETHILVVSGDRKIARLLEFRAAILAKRPQDLILGITIRETTGAPVVCPYTAAELVVQQLRVDAYNLEIRQAAETAYDLAQEEVNTHVGDGTQSIEVIPEEDGS